jgi:hypothetical protein
VCRWWPLLHRIDWHSQERSVSHTHLAIFKHFSPLIHNFTRETIVPLLSTHAMMNLSTWYTFCPQKNVSQNVAPPWCNSQVLLLCSPLCSNSHIKCKVNRLTLPTGHMTPYNTSFPNFSIFFKNIKAQKLFEDPGI